MEQILEQIRAERVRQDRRHGGQGHDDAHIELEWVQFIEEHADKAFRSATDGNPSGYRQRLIEVAALAVAAVESYDRKQGK